MKKKDTCHHYDTWNSDGETWKKYDAENERLGNAYCPMFFLKYKTKHKILSRVSLWGLYEE